MRVDGEDHPLEVVVLVPVKDAPLPDQDGLGPVPQVGDRPPEAELLGVVQPASAVRLAEEDGAGGGVPGAEVVPCGGGAVPHRPFQVYSEVGRPIGDMAAGGEEEEEQGGGRSHGC